MVVQVFAPELNDGKGTAWTYALPFDTSQHGVVSHVSPAIITLCHCSCVLSKVSLGAAAKEGDSNPATQLLLSSTTGALQLWQQGTVKWVREESLSEIQVAEFIELPEKKAAMAHFDQESESFAGRISRQIYEAKVCI